MMEESVQSLREAERIALLQRDPDIAGVAGQDPVVVACEVKKPETINYRTFKPERDGLFCAKNLRADEGLRVQLRQVQAHAASRRGVREVRRRGHPSRRVRRERMGHIDLATPVAHIWFLKSLPSRIGTLLDMTLRSSRRSLLRVLRRGRSGYDPTPGARAALRGRYASSPEDTGPRLPGRHGRGGDPRALKKLDGRQAVRRLPGRMKEADQRGAAEEISPSGSKVNSAFRTRGTGRSG